MKIPLPGFLRFLVGGIYFLLFSPFIQAQESASPDTRVYRSYHQEGILELKYEYYYDFWSEQPILHGSWSLWWKDGTLRESRTYQDGSLHGLYNSYRRDGSLKKSVSYRGDLPSGDTQSFFKSGMLRRSVSMLEGEKSGLSKWFYPDGTLKKVITYHNGKKSGPSQRFAKDGSLRSDRNNP